MGRLRDKLRNKEYRDAHVESMTRNWFSYQIRLLREDRGWSQKYLAEKMGIHQSTIARWEHPNYEGTSLQSLLRLAAAFDVAFIAQFVSFDELLERRKDLSPDAMRVPSYVSERAASPPATEAR